MFQKNYKPINISVAVDDFYIVSKLLLPAVMFSVSRYQEMSMYSIYVIN